MNDMFFTIFPPAHRSKKKGNEHKAPWSWKMYSDTLWKCFPISRQKNAQKRKIEVGNGKFSEKWFVLIEFSRSNHVGKEMSSWELNLQFNSFFNCISSSGVESNCFPFFSCFFRLPSNPNWDFSFFSERLLKWAGEKFCHECRWHKPLLSHSWVATKLSNFATKSYFFPANICFWFENSRKMWYLRWRIYKSTNKQVNYVHREQLFSDQDCALSICSQIVSALNVFYPRKLLPFPPKHRKSEDFPVLILPSICQL